MNKARVKKLEKKISLIERKNKMPIVFVNLYYDLKGLDGVEPVMGYTGTISGKRYWAINISNKLFKTEEEMDAVIDEYIEKHFDLSELTKEAERIMYIIGFDGLEKWKYWEKYKDKLGGDEE